MAVALDIKILNSLPAGPYANSTLYIIKSATAGLMDVYLSANDGLTVRHVISSADVDTKIANAIAALDAAQVVADITARDALTPTKNIQVLVLDASDDPTVTAGAATYIYDLDTTTWYKISEAESLDLVLSWANLTGKPTSSVADIDDAVAKRHAHANLAVLDDLSESVDGLLQYGGTLVGAVASTVEW